MEAGMDSIACRSSTRAVVRRRERSRWTGPTRTAGGLPSVSRTTNGTFHVPSTKGRVYFVTSSESANAIRRPTISRCRMPGSIPTRVLPFVERSEATLRRCLRFGTRNFRGVLEEMLHRMARFAFAKEVRGLSLVEAEPRRQMDSKLFVIREQDPYGTHEFREHEALGYVQVLPEFFGERVPRTPLGAGSRHLNQVVRELELTSAGVTPAGDCDPARHHLPRVRPEAIILPSTRAPQVDVGPAQRLIASNEIVRPPELATEVLVHPQD